MFMFAERIAWFVALISQGRCQGITVEDLTNLLKNKSLVFNPEDVDFDGLSE